MEPHPWQSTCPQNSALGSVGMGYCGGIAHATRPEFCQNVRIETVMESKWRLWPLLSEKTHQETGECLQNLRAPLGCLLVHLLVTGLCLPMD